MGSNFFPLGINLKEEVGALCLPEMEKREEEVKVRGDKKFQKCGGMMI